MSMIKDCGDMTVTVILRTGVKYTLAAVGDDETLARCAIDDKIAEILPNLEKTLLEQICDHIGYDKEKIEFQVALRNGKNAANRKAENEGRATKKAVRDGLPPPPPPPVAHDLEEANEQKDNTAE